MNLKGLAAINGISLSTAKCYKKDCVDLTDFEAVNAHKHAQRTRFGLSKLVHRAKDMQQAGERLQARMPNWRALSWIPSSWQTGGTRMHNSLLASMPAEPGSGTTPVGYHYREDKNWRGIPKPRRCPFCRINSK
jgi:hypothetical protein